MYDYENIEIARRSTFVISHCFIYHLARFLNNALQSVTSLPGGAAMTLLYRLSFDHSNSLPSEFTASRIKDSIRERICDCRFAGRSYEKDL